MTAGNAEGAASQQPPSTSHTSGISHGIAAGRQVKVFARPVLITARSGRTRAVLTYRCKACGDNHSCTALVPTPLLLRKTACGNGEVLLRTGQPVVTP